MAEGLNQPSPWEHLKNQICLGNEAFVDEMQCKMALEQKLEDIYNVQKQQASKLISDYSESALNRDQAITKAYQSGVHSLKQTGDRFSWHYSRVSRIIKKMELKDKT